MSMNITFYKKDSKLFYRLSAPLWKNKQHLELVNQDCEGGDFSADEIADVIYTALDKYFREKY